MKRIFGNGLTAVLFILGSLHAACADTFSAKVIAVMDGDTVLVLRDHTQIKVRLAEIDAPEKTQAFGEQSRQSLADLILRKQVRVDSQTTDTYGRLVALIKLDDLNINHEQIRRGMAWASSRSNKGKTLLALQNDAQKARRGLWAQTDPIPPKEWRNTHATPRPHQAEQSNLCGSKQHCSQMNSCDEAKFYLTHCNVLALDKNRNGVPCEQLCAVKK